MLKNLFTLYRKFNVFQGNCRFCPSCSQYTEDAIIKHGLVFGLFLAIKRIFRCNQWFPGGFDPVP